MKRYSWYLILVLPCTTAVADSPGAFDWPQWQGADRNAASKNADCSGNGRVAARRSPGRSRGLGAETARRLSPPAEFSA